MTLTDLLDEIADRGWLVSNLFQLSNGSWQANLRTSTHHTEFGRGPSPELALSLAIEAIEDATENAPREIVRVNIDHIEAKPFDIFALLSKANLRPHHVFKGRLS